MATPSNPNSTKAKRPSISIRQGQPTDMEWLYRTFKKTMQGFISETWGWDELLQEHSFYENLPAKSFTIATLDQRDVGALNLREKADHLWLEMVLVLPDYQAGELADSCWNMPRSKRVRRKNHCALVC